MTGWRAGRAEESELHASARSGGRPSEIRAAKTRPRDRRVVSRYLVAALRRVFQVLARARAIPRGDSSIPEFASNRGDPQCVSSRVSAEVGKLR